MVRPAVFFDEAPKLLQIVSVRSAHAMPDDLKKRPQTATQRELVSEAARAERLAAQRAAERVRAAIAEATAEASSGAPAFAVEAVDEVTGKHDGDELAALRAMRPPEDRLDRLERKHDKLADDVGDVRESMGRIEGTLAVLPTTIAQAFAVAQSAASAQTQTAHVVMTAQVDIDKATKLDVIDARKARRALAAKIVAAVLGSGVLGALGHYLIGKV